MIDLSISPSQRQRVAKEYAKGIFEKYSIIEAIIATGSIIRGNALPTSDIDLWYIIPQETQIKDIRKGVYQGVFIDIEPFFLEELTIEKVLLDAYTLGYLTGAAILCDRTGKTTQVIQEVQSSIQDEYYKDRRLQKIADPVKRNLGELKTASELNYINQKEICRAGIFTLWDLTDYLLEKANTPPGGFRSLARLKQQNTDAFIKILQLQGSIFMDQDSIKRFINIYDHNNEKEIIWMQKKNWMVDNGFKDEAFNMLWIIFGLVIKDGRSDEFWLLETCRQWLDELGWKDKALENKVIEYEKEVMILLG